MRDTDADTDAVGAYYDVVAPAYAAALPDDSFEAPSDLAVLDRFLGLLPASARLLDAGCGTGRMIPRLRRDGRRVEGLDLSAAMLGEAQRRFPDVPLRVGDVRALPHGDAVLDGVLAWYSLIHLDLAGLAGAIAEAARVLRPGGALLAAFQAGTGTRRTGGYGREASVQAVLHEVEEVASAVRSAGLEVVLTNRREPRPGERWAQGFVLARRPLTAPTP